MQRRGSMIGAVVAVVAAVLTTSASAAPVARQKAAFEGQCQLSGAVRFTPALTAQPRPGSGHATATGTCTGTLTGRGGTRQLTDAPVAYRASDRSDLMGCGGGPGVGKGVLRIARQSLAFTLEETRAAAFSELHLTGSGWTADGVAGASASADPAAVAAACGGDGLRSAPIDIVLSFSRS